MDSKETLERIAHAAACTALLADMRASSRASYFSVEMPHPENKGSRPYIHLGHYRGRRPANVSQHPLTREEGAVIQAIVTAAAKRSLEVAEAECRAAVAAVSIVEEAPQPASST